jgi:hypothetical protein
LDGSQQAVPARARTLGSCSTNSVRAGIMAVTKELLQMDLYALLGIEEKAADKEVSKVAKNPERSGGTSCPGGDWHPLSRLGSWGGEQGATRRPQKVGFQNLPGRLEGLTRKRGSEGAWRWVAVLSLCPLLGRGPGEPEREAGFLSAPAHHQPLLQPPQYWDYRRTPSHRAHFSLFCRLI